MMVVATTSAAALAAGSAVAGVAPPHRASALALALLTLSSAALMVLAGLVRLGRYTRFVSHSVMTGFLAGVAVNIVLGQLPDLAVAAIVLVTEPPSAHRAVAFETKVSGAGCRSMPRPRRIRVGPEEERSGNPIVQARR